MDSTQLTIDQIINGDMLELMGAKNMSPERRAALYNKALDTIYIRILARVDDTLSDAEAQEWKAIVDQGDHARNEAFLRDHKIDLPSLLAQEALIYKLQMVELSGAFNAPPRD